MTGRLYTMHPAGGSGLSVYAGVCVGGSTLVNDAICWRPTPEVLASWREDVGVDALTDAAFAAYVDRAWTDIHASARDATTCWDRGPQPWRRESRPDRRYLACATAGSRAAVARRVARPGVRALPLPAEAAALHAAPAGGTRRRSRRSHGPFLRLEAYALQGIKSLVCLTFYSAAPSRALTGYPGPCGGPKGTRAIAEAMEEEA
jgi:hypothetical protein